MALKLNNTQGMVSIMTQYTSRSQLRKIRKMIISTSYCTIAIAKYEQVSPMVYIC